MEMITGSKITGFLWPVLIVDWPLTGSLQGEGGDFSGLYGLRKKETGNILLR